VAVEQVHELGDDDETVDAVIAVAGREAVEEVGVDDVHNDAEEDDEAE